jgi:RimJ/RimL family protein N-acetyltransferase
MNTRGPESPWLELFDDKEVLPLMRALAGHGDYGTIRQSINRPSADLAPQIEAFREGTLTGAQLHWAIRDCASSACLGSIAVTYPSNRRLTIGYRVSPESRCAGVATAAVRLVIPVLNGWLPGTPVFATVNPENSASLRVLRKAGFEVVMQSADTTSTLGRQSEIVMKRDWSAPGAA